MCRNIKRLRYPDYAPSDAEIHDAALQFVRKISGYHKPSQANAKAFDAAVREVARAGRKLFDSLHEGRSGITRSVARAAPRAISPPARGSAPHERGGRARPRAASRA